MRENGPTQVADPPGHVLGTKQAAVACASPSGSEIGGFIEMMRFTFVLAPLAFCIVACAPGGPEGEAAAPTTREPADAVGAAKEASAAGAFDETFELQGISFRVTCANAASTNEVTIQPSSLEIDNSAVAREADGTVVGAEVADLDADGSPEIYVYVSSAGSGSYGSLVAFAANNRKSLSDIYLPPLEDDPGASAGYMGHDQFAVVELRLVRRFPIYREGDSNARPTGGTRQLVYKLEAGEAGWLLRIVDRMDFDVELPVSE